MPNKIIRLSENDSNCDIGIYTEQPIPKESICLVGKCQFKKK